MPRQKKSASLPPVLAGPTKKRGSMPGVAVTAETHEQLIERVAKRVVRRSQKRLRPELPRKSEVLDAAPAADDGGATRREMRKLSNRIAARNSRERKQRFIEAALVDLGECDNRFACIADLARKVLDAPGLADDVRSSVALIRDFAAEMSSDLNKYDDDMHGGQQLALLADDSMQ